MQSRENKINIDELLNSIGEVSQVLGDKGEIRFKRSSYS